MFNRGEMLCLEVLCCIKNVISGSLGILEFGKGQPVIREQIFFVPDVFSDVGRRVGGRGEG